MTTVKKILVLPAALDNKHPLHIGYVGKGEKNMAEYSLEDIVMVPTKCERCGVEGMAPTMKQILENEDSILRKMLDEKGYADILCADCAEKVAGNKEATE